MKPKDEEDEKRLLLHVLVLLVVAAPKTRPLPAALVDGVIIATVFCKPGVRRPPAAAAAAITRVAHCKSRQQ